MFIYILTFYVIVLFVLLNPQSDAKAQRFFRLLSLIYLIWFVGLRHKVGGDWRVYLGHFKSLELSLNNFFGTLLSFATYRVKKYK